MERPWSLQPGDLITVAQALQLLPVGKSLLYDLIGDGSIPHIRVSSIGSRRGRILILRRGLEEFVDRLRARTGPLPPGRPSTWARSSSG